VEEIEQFKDQRKEERGKRKEERGKRKEERGRCTSTFDGEG
jgi:hypothetical protein